MTAVEKAGLTLGSLLVLNSYTTFESFCKQSNSAHLNPYITLSLLLASRLETLRPDLVSGCVAAFAVAVQTSSRTTDSIVVVAGEHCAWF